MHLRAPLRQIWVDAMSIVILVTRKELIFLVRFVTSCCAFMAPTFVVTFQFQEESIMVVILHFFVMPAVGRAVVG